MRSEGFIDCGNKLQVGVEKYRMNDRKNMVYMCIAHLRILATLCCGKYQYE